MQKILLTIKGSNYSSLEKEPIEFITEGLLKINPDGYLLEFDETELTGKKGVTTKVLLENGCVTLIRDGDADTHMVIKENQVFESNISSAHGMIRMNVFAHHVRSVLNDKSGSLDIEYEVSTDEMSTTNRLNLSFKRVEDYIN